MVQIGLDLSAAPETSLVCLEDDPQEIAHFQLGPISGRCLASCCPMRLNAEESNSHLLFSCIFASGIWKWVLLAAGYPVPPSFSASSLIHSLSIDSVSAAREGLGAIFISVAYNIWKARKKCVFYFIFKI